MPSRNCGQVMAAMSVSESVVLLFGTEGATDPDLDEALTKGCPSCEVNVSVSSECLSDNP